MNGGNKKRNKNKIPEEKKINLIPFLGSKLFFLYHLGWEKKSERKNNPPRIIIIIIIEKILF